MQDVAKMMMYDAKKKSTGVAYLLWFVLGWIGAHRFYAGHTLSGLAYVVLQVVAFITLFAGVGVLVYFVIGLWWLLDAFLLGNMISRQNMRLAANVHTGERH